MGRGIGRPGRSIHGRRDLPCRARAHSKPGADPTTSLELVKSPVNAIDHENRPAANGMDQVGKNLPGLHVYHNIVFIEKPPTARGAVPQWIPHEPLWLDGELTAPDSASSASATRSRAFSEQTNVASR